MFDKDGLKYVSADRLIQLLRGLPPDARVYVNRVGNLGVQGVDGTWLGYVDFAEETLELDQRLSHASR